MASSASSSSVVPRKGWTYDVFLSFRGEDTRNNFVDHLFAALILKGIHTFKDDKMLGGGQPISQELMKSIQESRFYVVVFSKNYANSSWCLEELSSIMECQNEMGQKVLPVFYHVDPSDVRKQKGDFEAAFETHEYEFKGEMDKVNKWREALTATANLSGQHILPLNGGEASFISKIVQEILAEIQPRGGGRKNHLIGIESRIDALNSLLKLEETQEVRITGICGMGGIGKTTIARALFNRMAYRFEGSSFVSDVRENSCSKKDICALQEQILSNILGERQGYKIQDCDNGAEMIQERLCRKKVLVILDDVNDVKQIEYLAGTREWFGPGSRIIITTRDQHLLSFADVDDKYKPALLHTDEALELFSRHAFRKSSPPDGYMDLSNQAINFTGRLPLALKVLGSFLCGREAGVWGSALDTLARTQSGEVFDTLKLSFDHLNVFEKQIFLDIACFYKGHDVQRVTRMLDSVIGISVLVEKSLIIISSHNTLGMHDLIQEMGLKIVEESAPNSRLWQPETIHSFIGKSKNPNSWLWHLKKMLDLIRKTENRKTEVIEGIVVPQEEIDQGFGFSPHVFESMKKLRILEVDRYFTWFKPTYLPDELQWFCWNAYPFSSLPVAHMNKLIGLEMEFGKIKHLWKGKKIMLENLKFIHLKYCTSLRRFPDVSGAPNIERLDLSWCHNMVEVDESFGCLKKLLHLDMSSCVKIKRLPSMLHMESLETLILSSCSSLKTIPEFSPCMLNLSHLDFSFCFKIQQLPSSIRYLSKLSILNLDYCFSLNNIPNSICELKCLTTLGLSSCLKLEKLPDEFKSIQSLEDLRIESSNFHDLINFTSLRRLHLTGDIGDNDFPENLHGLSTLEELHIVSNYKLTKVPESISHLSGLKHLRFWICKVLKTIHGLPSGIQVLIVDQCESLENIEDLSEKYERLYKIHLPNCPKLIEDEENERYLNNMLEQSFLEKWVAIDGCFDITIPGSNIPSWFKGQQDGCQITLNLLPGWQTKIAGFAMCFVVKSSQILAHIRLRFVNDGIDVPKSTAVIIDEIEEATNGVMGTGYIPFSLFEELHEDNNDDWFHMTEVNLVFEFSNPYGEVERCGAQVVYREDVVSIQQQTIPSISSYYWNWKLTKESINCIVCM